jgi:hypothetical protein
VSLRASSGDRNDEATGGSDALYDASRLIGVVAVAFLIVSALSVQAHGRVGFWAATIAAAVSLFGPLSAMVLTRFTVFREHPVAGVLVSMFMRMAFPLMFCLVVQLQGSRLVDAGMVYAILVFYLVVLAVETLSAVRRVDQASSAVGSI